MTAPPACPLTYLDEPEPVIRDANDNILQDGDTVIVVKDLPEKGASSNLKAGTKAHPGCELARLDRDRTLN